VSISAGSHGESAGSGIVIAVDGPSASGKSSTSRGAARALGLRYLDTGAMYRALTWWLLARGIPVDDADAVAQHVGGPVIEVGTDPDDPWVTVDDRDVSAAIRSREVSGAVSAVARVPQVRARLIALQREIIARARAEGRGIVAEGRDIGTVVAPHAEVKVFLDADPRERARRRAAELGVDVDTVLAEQAIRDERDRTREHSPLAPAEGSVTLDTTGTTLPEVIDRVVAIVRDTTG